MRIKKNKPKIDIVLGKGISCSLDQTRKDIKNKLNFSTLIEADEYIASEIKKIMISK